MAAPLTNQGSDAPLAGTSADPARKDGRPRIVHRSKKDPTARNRATGRRELTEDEQARLAAKTPQVPPGLPAPERAASAAVTVPRSVDNSVHVAFPEIRDQGSIGSCVPFAVGYYQYTYALGRLAGWNNKNGNNATKVSPKWLYNIVNGGSDQGSSPVSVHEVLKQHGALTWSEFPYNGDVSNPVNYLEWPRTTTLWRSALRYKSIDFASVEVPTTPESLANVKSLLAGGQVLTFSTYIYSWQFEQIDDDRSTSADNAFVGQSVASWVDGSEGAHEVALVGYNDDLWVDINADGIVQAAEKGAFKIANSWGPAWQNAGYVWVAYDALQWESQVPNGPSSDQRGGIMGTVTALTGARTNYQPKLVAEFTASTASRGSFPLFLGLSELDRTEPFVQHHHFAFGGMGGSYAFDGTSGTQAKSGSFALDFTDLALSYGDVKYSLYAQNWGETASTLSGFTLVDGLRNNTRIRTTDPTATIGQGETKAQSVRYKFQDPNKVPRLTVSPSSSVAFGSMPLGQSARRTVNLTNTGTGDLMVTSLRFSNPLFLARAAQSFRLPAGTSAPVDLEFAPAAGQAETSTLSIRNTSSNNTSPTLNLTGTGTSTNDSAPYQLFITQQNDPRDNSVALRAELKSRVASSTLLSDYQVVYYLNDPDLDPATLRWDTFQTSAGPISATVRRVFLNRELGVRKADLALTFRFAAGARLPADGSVIFQGQLRRDDYSWYPNETDDWSRYLRANGMAEGTIVQAIANKNVLFGLPAEGQPGAYQLAFSPNPVTTQTQGFVTFRVDNASQLGTEFVVAIHSEQGYAVQTHWTYPSELGTRTVVIPINGDRHNNPITPGRYTVVLSTGGARVDAVEFTRQ